MSLFKTLKKLRKIARLAFKPSLTSAFLLVLGALAFSQYEDFIKYFFTHRGFTYFFETTVMLSTLKWAAGVLILGYLFSYTFIINAHLQNEAIEKIKELESEKA